jgi:hypothetical protein
LLERVHDRILETLQAMPTSSADKQDEVAEAPKVVSMLGMARTA